jgi:hypothetical protein
VRGGFSCIFALVINHLGHWGRLRWCSLDILLNIKGFPIKVTVIGHLLVMPILPHLPWALGKYRLCDNKHHHGHITKILDLFANATWTKMACLITTFTSLFFV